jgi:hypothetical protein
LGPGNKETDRDREEGVKRDVISFRGRGSLFFDPPSLKGIDVNL